MENDEILTVEDVCKLLKVTKGWLYQRTRFGPETFPHVRVGRHLRFKREEVLKFFKLQNEHRKVA